MASEDSEERRTRGSYLIRRERKGEFFFLASGFFVFLSLQFQSKLFSISHQPAEAVGVQ